MLGSWVQWDTHDGDKKEEQPKRKDSVREDIERVYKQIFKEPAKPEVIEKVEPLIMAFTVEKTEAVLEYIEYQLKRLKRMQEDEELILLLL